MSTLMTWLAAGRRLAERVPYRIVALVARLAVASVFWRSAQTKVDGLHIKDTTFFLFREEYKVPVLPPDVAAYLATYQELAFRFCSWLGWPRASPRSVSCSWSRSSRSLSIRKAGRITFCGSRCCCSSSRAVPARSPSTT